MPGGEVVATAGEGVEGALDSLEDRLGREQLHLRSGELDRERQPVESGADLANRVGVRSVELEVRAHPAGSLDEQASPPARVEAPLQRTERVLLLAGDVQRGLARNEHRDRRGAV